MFQEQAGMHRQAGAKDHHHATIVDSILCAGWWLLVLAQGQPVDWGAQRS